MRKEITLGEFLATLSILFITLIGWGISVEVRLATHKTQIEHILKMDKKIDELIKSTSCIRVDIGKIKTIQEIKNKEDKK